MHDLAIVGAGPIGSYLAWKFSELGKDVLLLERNEPGKPLQCSGHISKKLFDFIPKKEKFIENEIHGARFHAGDETYRVDKNETISYVINRCKMDKWLAEKAVKEGAELKKENFKDAVELPGKVGIITDSDHREAKMLAGCDGPMSTVRKKLHLPDPKNMLHGIFTHSDGKKEGMVDVFLDRTENFFGWKIPRKDKVEYGLAAKPSNNAKKKLEKFSEEENFEINDIYSGMIPISPPGKTFSERCFLCGDAAAHVKPFTGGGIIYGLTAAEEAVKTINAEKAETISKYDSKWRKKLRKDIWIGERIRKVYSSSTLTKKMFLKGLVKFKDRIQMDQPSSFFK